MNISEKLREDLIGSDAQTLQRSAHAPDLEKLLAYIAAVKAVPAPELSNGSSRVFFSAFKLELHDAFERVMGLIA